MKMSALKYHQTAGTILLGMALLFHGCDSTPQLESRWLGKSKQSLVTAWGQPTGTETYPDGSEVYVYTKTFYPARSGPMGNPSDSTPLGYRQQVEEYPLQVEAESNTARFWISPEGTIYKVQGRIFE